MRDPREGGEEKGVSSMPEEYEFDADELASEIREHQRLTGTEDEASSGMTRRDLLVKGGAAAAAIGAAGALGGSAAAATRHVDRAGKFTGTLNVITLGVEFPTPEVAKRIKNELGF